MSRTSARARLGEPLCSLNKACVCQLSIENSTSVPDKQWRVWTNWISCTIKPWRLGTYGQDRTRFANNTRNLPSLRKPNKNSGSFPHQGVACHSRKSGAFYFDFCGNYSPTHAPSAKGFLNILHASNVSRLLFFRKYTGAHPTLPRSTTSVAITVYRWRWHA